MASRSQNDRSNAGVPAGLWRSKSLESYHGTVGAVHKGHCAKTLMQCEGYRAARQKIQA